MLDERTREYADWFVWAKRNLTSTNEICHAAAQAAMDAKAGDRDPQLAARAAASSRSGAGWSDPADPETRLFAEWYDWSRTELGASGEALTRAASAAVESLRHSPDGGAAAGAARAALTGEVAPQPVPPPQAAPPPAPAAPPAPPPPAPATGAWTPPGTRPPAPPPPPPQPPPPPAPAAPAQAAWTPPGAPTPGQPYAGSPLPPPPSPAAYPPGYGPAYGGAPAYSPAYGPPAGRVEVPVWVAVLLGIGGAFSLLIAIAYTVVLIGQPQDQQLALGSEILLGISLVMLFPSAIALVGVIRHTSWARAMSIVAGAGFCLSCVGLVLGVPVIIGAALAKPAQPEWRPR